MGSNHCKCESCEEFEADFPGVLVPTELVIPQKAFGDTAAEDDTQDTAEDESLMQRCEKSSVWHVPNWRAISLNMDSQCEHRTR